MFLIFIIDKQITTVRLLNHSEVCINQIKKIYDFSIVFYFYKNKERAIVSIETC